jgi:hypothetical protein
MKALIKIPVRAAWDSNHQMWRVEMLLGCIWEKIGSATLLYHHKSEAVKAARKFVKSNPDNYDYRS